MPALRCSAERCMYNKGQLCAKSDIQIQGDHASSADGTCCSSFQERTGAQNAADCGPGHDTVDVACSACECEYNHKSHCHAGAVDISGSHACTCGETCCGSFQCKDK